MDRSRIAQAYGYVVCLIAVITFLISLNSAVGAALDMGDPLHSTSARAALFRPDQASLTSFEAYRMDMRRLRGGESQGGPALDEVELRAAYETARREHIAAVRFQATRQLVTSALLLLVSVALFVTHWVWLRRLGARE